MTIDSTCRRVIWVVLMGIIAQKPLTAQTEPAPPSPVSVGVSFQQMIPKGEFRRNIGDGSWQHQGALGIHLIFHLKPSGLVNLRLDYFFGQYDRDPCGGYCNTYTFRAGGIGPELVLPHGPVRPYLTASLGRLSIHSFNDPNGGKADSGAGYLMYGGGIRIPARGSWSIDLAYRNHNAGSVSYQHELRNPDGSTSVGSSRTRTPFIMYTVGIQYRFKGSTR